MNKVTLTGNLCREVEVKYTTNETMVVSNAIAVRNDYKNANGEYESQFFNIVAFNNVAKFVGQYGAKGSRVLVDGRLQNREYTDKDGNKKNITEIIAEKVEIFDKKEEKTSTFDEMVKNTISDDDLPF